MKRYAVITIDTEADHDGKWRKSRPLKFDSVLSGIPERLQPLFNKFNACPTYLLTIEVMENRDCVSTLKSLKGRFELGTHLHPEYAAPDKKYEVYDGTLSKDFSCNLDPNVEFLKIKRITEIFFEKFGYMPVSYRAGRFGAGGNTIRSLEKLGYKVDTSVTPYCFWEGDAGLDFTSAPDSLYFSSHDDVKKRGDSKIMEAPVSIRPRRYLSKKMTSFIERAAAIKKIPFISNLAYRYLCPVWLEPAFSNNTEMEYVINRVVEESKDMAVVNIMFHSMEIIKGTSPMSRTQKKINIFLNRLEWLLLYLKNNGFEFSGLSELYKIYA